jgi:hypothetical protein
MFEEDAALDPDNVGYHAGVWQSIAQVTAVPDDSLH